MFGIYPLLSIVPVSEEQFHFGASLVSTDQDQWAQEHLHKLTGASKKQMFPIIIIRAARYVIPVSISQCETNHMQQFLHSLAIYGQTGASNKQETLCYLFNKYHHKGILLE